MLKALAIAVVALSTAASLAGCVEFEEEDAATAARSGSTRSLEVAFPREGDVWTVRHMYEGPEGPVVFETTSRIRSGPVERLDAYARPIEVYEVVTTTTQGPSMHESTGHYIEEQWPGTSTATIDAKAGTWVVTRTTSARITDLQDGDTPEVCLRAYENLDVPTYAESARRIDGALPFGTVVTPGHSIEVREEWTTPWGKVKVLYEYAPESWEHDEALSDEPTHETLRTNVRRTEHIEYVLPGFVPSEEFVTDYTIWLADGVPYPVRWAHPATHPDFTYVMTKFTPGTTVVHFDSVQPAAKYDGIHPDAKLYNLRDIPARLDDVGLAFPPNEALAYALGNPLAGQSYLWSRENPEALAVMGEHFPDADSEAKIWKFMLHGQARTAYVEVERRTSLPGVHRYQVTFAEFPHDGSSYGDHHVLDAAQVVDPVVLVNVLRAHAKESLPVLSWGFLAIELAPGEDTLIGWFESRHGAREHGFVVEPVLYNSRTDWSSGGYGVDATRGRTHGGLLWGGASCGWGAGSLYLPF